MKTAKIEQTIAQDKSRVLSVANQNTVAPAPSVQNPQWYDVKFMVEEVYALRAKVRQAIAARKSIAQMDTAIHHLNRDIAISLQEYRKANAQYQAAWNAYFENLRCI